MVSHQSSEFGTEQKSALGHEIVMFTTRRTVSLRAVGLAASGGLRNATAKTSICGGAYMNHKASGLVKNLMRSLRVLLILMPLLFGTLRGSFHGEVRPPACSALFCLQEASRKS